MSEKVRDKKSIIMLQNSRIIQFLFKLDIFWIGRHFFCTLLHPLYDSRSFLNIKNCKVPVADSKIWRRVLFVQNVHNFHQKTPQAMLAHLQLSSGLNAWHRSSSSNIAYQTHFKPIIQHNATVTIGGNELNQLWQ